MKSASLLALSIIAFWTAGFENDTSTIPLFPTTNSTTVMSYNIELEGAQHIHSWTKRRNLVAQVIRSKRPEILGLQESSMGQTNWIKENLYGYDSYSLGSEDGLMRGDMCPIFYSEQAYERLDQGTFWLSLSPNSPGSTSWNSSPKTVNWVKLKHMRSEQEVFAFNTQFEMDNPNAQMESARLLRERVLQITDGGTFIILGDFCCEPHHEPVTHISSWAKDSQVSSLVRTTDIDDTFFGWTKNEAKSKRVDYVFLSQNIPANSYEVIDVAHKETYPSDHLPVYCRLRLK